MSLSGFRKVIYGLQITCFYHHFAPYWKDNSSADMLVLCLLLINREIPFSLLVWSGLLAFWISVFFGLLVWHTAGCTLMSRSSWCLCLLFCMWSLLEIPMVCFLISQDTRFSLYTVKKGSLCHSSTISQTLSMFTLVFQWGFSEELSKVTGDPSI